MIHDQQKLFNFLLQRNMVHFNQAHGTPFTMEPLNKLDWNACSPESQTLLQGQIPPEITSSNRFVMEILRSIAEKTQLPEIDTYLSPDDVAWGFRCWKEATSTSPCGSRWNGLLNAAGHFMELSKCACYLSIWKFQDDGYAYTMSPEEHGQQIFVCDINGHEKEIPQLESNQQS
jgi:hypothetical protein